VKVAIAHDWLTGMRGGERVLEMICRLFPSADIYTLFYFPENISTLIRSHRIISSNLQWIPGARRYYRNLLPFFPAAIESFDLQGYDLVISTSHAVAKGVIPDANAVSICYCHTPMRYIWDLYDTYFNQEYNPIFIRHIMSVFKDYLRFWDRMTAGRVDYFIANSRYVSDRILRTYNRQSTVINPPVDTEFYQPSGYPPKDFYLVVSALAPYKRIDIAIQVFNQMNKPLKIIGSGPEYKRLKSLAGPSIQFLGQIRDDAEVKQYFQDCRALIFPGIEDFGLTPLETLACGRPVIAFAQGGVLETVVEGISGHFFYKQTVDALANAIYEFEEMDWYPEILRQRALQYDSTIMLRDFIQFFDLISEENKIAIEYHRVE
jgi:glycosyltransferase involved in cell wall biosynthesis